MGPQLSALSSQLRAKRGGFALLITVTLLAFIVILLVGLAAFTRVETSVAGNSQRQAQARENALLALNVALGQLQKYAGADQRVTATADAISTRTGTRHYTGVWQTDQIDATSGGPQLLSWLVSGNELRDADGVAQPLAVTPDAAMTTANSVAVVSTNTTRTTNDVQARLVPLTATVLPGLTGTTPTTIGRYAWWVGDQGVKAPVAVADPSASVNYAPYDSADLRSRLRQQVPLGAGAFDVVNSAPMFEPRDSNNASLVANQKVTAMAQLAFLKNSSNAQIGLRTEQQNFHAWSPNNFAVVANSKLGGLRQDLSVKPDLLGGGFVAWANYDPANGGYMEDPTAPAADPSAPQSSDPAAVVHPPISPAYSSDPIRRRYAFVPPNETAGVRHSVAPVLSFFGLSFSIRNNATGTNLDVSARCVVGLWNPYSSALVPEDLQIVVRGLPNHVSVHDSQSADHVHVDVDAVMADSSGEVKFFLPFTADGSHADTSSWLPGRIYNWSAESNTVDPADGNGKPMAFYARAAAQKDSGVVRPAGAARGLPVPSGANAVRITRWCDVNTETRLTIELRRASDGQVLGEFHSPVFADFETDHDRLDTTDAYLDFAYIFRMADGLEIPAGETASWLQAAGRDPRQRPLPAGAYVGPGFGVLSDGRLSPALLIDSRKTDFDASYPDILLDRAPGSRSYNEDVPVFELPRGPILSLGALQHLQLPGQRPFAVGNSWGAAAQINGIATAELFDRFYFSGLANGITPITSGGSLLLPNPLLKVFPRDRSTGATLTADDLRNAPDAKSSKFLLASSAFNLNSTSAAAWAAVLRSVRFPVAQFSYLNASFDSGTSGDSKTSAPVSTDAQFFRFPQSAQETYEADDPVDGVTYAASTAAPPNAPDPASTANTHYFRRGMRTLTATQVTTLAGKIADAVKARQAAQGPFRSLEEFLAPPAPGTPSLLEQAIADAAINVDASGNPIEFSSQFLTQADIMTALAPILFARSDTFLIRTYGDVVNPATSAVEGRAWCEATVQRVPEYLEPSADAPEVLPADLTSNVNKAHGRRFKVVSFRWLTLSDI